MTTSLTHPGTTIDLSNTRGVVDGQGITPSLHTDTHDDYGSAPKAMGAQEKGIPTVATITFAMSGLGNALPHDGKLGPRLILLALLLVAGVATLH
jgi:hypothetical protein